MAGAARRRQYKAGAAAVVVPLAQVRVSKLSVTAATRGSTDRRRYIAERRPVVRTKHESDRSERGPREGQATERDRS